MTRREKIRTFLKILSQHLGIDFVRGDQSGKRPNYPFFSYKMLSSDAGSAQEVIETMEPIDNDDTKIKKKSIRESKLVVSLNFFSDEASYENLIEIAEKAYSWIDSLAGLEVADEIGIGISVSNHIQDRTVFFETEYEYRFGFDIEIRDKTITTEIVDTIDIGQVIKELREGGN